MSINEAMRGYGAAKSAIREIAAYAAQRKAEIGATQVFDFSLGNPSIPAPQEVHDALAKALDLPATELHSYTPAAGLTKVRAALASSLNARFGAGTAQADDLYLTCGAAASICISLKAVVCEGDEVIVIAPYFPEYKVWIETVGARCIEVMADSASFQPDSAAIAAAITPRTKAIIVNSPNNPTGVVYTRERLEQLAAMLQERSAALEQEIYLISDEPYREIVYGAEPAWAPSIYERTLVCYSYSKSLSLPGERIGWVLVPGTNPEHDLLVQAVAGAGRALGYVCAPAMFQRVIEDCADVRPDTASYQRNRDALVAALRELSYEYVEPEGAFYLWVKALEDDAVAFCERAKEFELLPVPSDSFGCTGWIRIGYCVDYETIINSLPAWEKLTKLYR